MITKTIKHLAISSSGTSRGRIVLVAHDGRIPDLSAAARAVGTRWITFGPAAVYDLSILIRTNSWNALDKEIPGGMTSGTWRKLKKPALEYPETAVITPHLTAANFGTGSNRIVLLSTNTTNEYEPIRLGKSSWIALDPAAFAMFASWFWSIATGTSEMVERFAFMPGGIGGGTIGNLRAALEQYKPAVA